MRANPAPRPAPATTTERLAPPAGPALGETVVVLRCDGHVESTVTLLRGTAVRVGSGAAAALRLAEPSLSREHAEVVHEGDHVRIRDLGSTNGVVIAGVRVGTARLHPGASARVGRAELQIVGGPASELPAPLPGLVGRSVPMLLLSARVRRFAPLPLPVLVRGESGTGKDAVARALHTLSGRAGPFVALNAATISSELAESELFGHRRGSFTGAYRDRRGAFREADGGTLFIDEVAALPTDVQAKLLRAVEEGTVRPVGAEGAVRVESRIVAATCEPLEDRVLAGLFRSDLYERLAACIVRVPPLGERMADLDALATHLLATLELGPVAIDPDAIRALGCLRYPGNVRQLRSLLTHAALAARESGGAVIRAEHVTAAAAERGQAGPAPDVAIAIVRANGGNVSLAARKCGIPRSTLRDLLKRAASG